MSQLSPSDCNSKQLHPNAFMETEYRIVRHRTPIRSPSPHHPPIPDLEELNRLLSRKPERSYSPEYRGSSTPEVYHPDFLFKLLQPLEYYKAKAIQITHRVRLLDPSTDHRRSIDSIEYWRTEYTHMIKEFFNITQRQNQERWDKLQMMNSQEEGNAAAECPQDALPTVTRNKGENKGENRKTESAGDGPVSCRLRSRAPRIDRASQPLSTAAAPRGISKTKSKTTGKTETKTKGKTETKTQGKTKSKTKGKTKS